MDENELDLGARIKAVGVKPKFNNVLEALTDIAWTLRKIEVVHEYKALVASEQLATLQEDMEDENSDPSRGT